MSDKTVIHNSQVKETRQDGIVYVDNEGNEQFIDFEVCYQNYLKRRLSPQEIESYKELNNKTDSDVPAYIDGLKKWRRIADRNILGDGIGNGEYGSPYFEFYTQPRVRIEFENQDKLWEMRHKLEREFRWRTFDLT